MIQLKPLKPEATAASLEKAKRYRLLNEPDVAESICLDILAGQPGHQEALITLLLALTDKFRVSGIVPAFEQAQEVIPQLDSSYSKAYYHGVIFERRAKFHLHQGGPGAGGPGRAPPGFDAAARKLGVSQVELLKAVNKNGGRQLDTAATAKDLGVTEAALKAALPRPPGH